ncbi:MAG: hypothetical protein GX767_03185 [Firmicutes bacterium]|nr:hypothetical protein [Bacillota bacterium]
MFSFVNVAGLSLAVLALGAGFSWAIKSTQLARNNKTDMIIIEDYLEYIEHGAFNLPASFSENNK